MDKLWWVIVEHRHVQVFCVFGLGKRIHCCWSAQVQRSWGLCFLEFVFAVGQLLKIEVIFQCWPVASSAEVEVIFVECDTPRLKKLHAPVLVRY
jgi:hypothetical protein